MNPLHDFVRRHPQITAWLALAVGMEAILFWAAKDVGLLPTQMATLAATTFVVAGLCIWIIGWD